MQSLWEAEVGSVWESETGKGRNPVNGMVLCRLSLWATGTQLENSGR